MQSELIGKIKETLSREQRITFAYLYGSSLHTHEPGDIDIAIYVEPEESFLFFSLPGDLKVDLSKNTGIPPDRFDVRIINNLLTNEDAFSLFYLKDVLNGILLVDRDTELRCKFIERFSMKYRESEGILSEALYVPNR